MSILITIGIVAKNEEKYIGETLKGIINQIFDNSLYEIIVVDGNSSDRTREIAENVLGASYINYKVLNEKDFGFYGLCFSSNSRYLPLGFYYL